jgi:putative ubiquitin-RnfH superfamily antitoxin RatB of RatAB toxin-antitoxin module
VSVPGAADRKRCVVVYATRDRQHLWNVEVPLDATIAQALQAARAACSDTAVCAAISWERAPLGVFGEPRLRTDVFADGDRIEIYRPLRCDPRERRRERVQRERSAASRQTLK